MAVADVIRIGLGVVVGQRVGNGVKVGSGDSVRVELGAVVKLGIAVGSGEDVALTHVVPVRVGVSVTDVVGESVGVVDIGGVGVSDGVSAGDGCFV